MEKKIKKRVMLRLKILEGQIRGLQRMVTQEKYCIDIIEQSLAVKQALSGVEDLLLENHLAEHVIHQMKGNQEKKAIAEIVEIFKRAKRK